ncbi:hypothetical protein KSP40_PGU016061 [Platanthera guangdongensis]|uniref:Transcription repressor n=1 Tax=Platanthera guangdongensis TaxID=2320717 RepID=A0ABR2N4I9_9ASPA
MSSASRRRFSMKHPAVVVDVGCGCNRRRKLSSLLSYFQRRTKLHPRGGAAAAAAHNSFSTSPSSGAATSLWASTGMTNSSSSFYSASHEDSAASPAVVPQQATEKAAEKRRRRSRKKRGDESAVAESVEVVKESSEPYADFKESMVQMIVENELYSSEDLNDLLHRFLVINSPRHHHVILRAFADLWPRN